MTIQDEKVASENVHRLSHAALALVETFSRSGPIKAELDNLKALAPGDALLEAAAGSIPADAAAKGIPTIPQLKQRYDISGVGWVGLFVFFDLFCGDISKRD